MNAFMLDKWNDVVTSDDTVIYGGDLVLNSSRDYRMKVSFVLSYLNGKKILVRGNHDRSHSTMCQLGFESSNLYYFKDNILVVHDLMRRWHIKEIADLIEKADYVLYGHVHNQLLDDPRVKDNPKFINICVEHLDYIPRTLEELKEIRNIQLQRGI